MPWISLGHARPSGRFWTCSMNPRQGEIANCSRTRDESRSDGCSDGDFRHLLDRNMILKRNRGVAKSIARCALRMWAIALTFGIPAMGQAAGVSLPFVGCVSYGQAVKVEAPRGASVQRPFRSDDAGDLAYYKSAEI